MRITASPYSKTFYVWDCVSAIFFYGGTTPFHSHNTLQLAFDMRNAFKCRTQNKDWEVYKSIIIKENVIHQLDPNESVQLILYLDAESETAKAIRLNYLSGKDIFSPGLEIKDYAKPGELERCLIEPNPELLERLVHRLLNQLVDSQRSVLIDERIKKVIQLIATNGSGMTINQLAKNVFLSESRLRFLFRKVKGVPLHRYIIWNKILLAIEYIINGATVKDAAMDCGFTDSSHFHKLLLGMFGVSPSQFIKDNSKKNFRILTSHPMSMESRVFGDDSCNAFKTYSP